MNSNITDIGIHSEIKTSTDIVDNRLNKQCQDRKLTGDNLSFANPSSLSYNMLGHCAQRLLPYLELTRRWWRLKYDCRVTVTNWSWQKGAGNTAIYPYIAIYGYLLKRNKCSPSEKRNIGIYTLCAGLSETLMPLFSLTLYTLPTACLISPAFHHTFPTK